MTKKTLFKLSLFILFIFVGLGAYLAYNIVNKSAPVEALFEEPWATDATCRTVGDACSQSQFTNNRTELGDGEMFYCKQWKVHHYDGAGNPVYLWPDGYYYGTTVKGKFGTPGFGACGASCVGKDGYHKAPDCNNDYFCGNTQGKISAEVKCDGKFIPEFNSELKFRLQNGNNPNIAEQSGDQVTFTTDVAGSYEVQLLTSGKVAEISQRNGWHITGEQNFVKTVENNGKATFNFYGCSKTPVDEPKQQLTVTAACVDGNPNGRRFQLNVDIPDVAHREFPNTAIGTQDNPTRVTVNNLKNLPKPVNLSAINVPQGLWVSKNTCEGRSISNGGECGLEFKGCGGSNPQNSRYSVNAICTDGTRETLNIGYTASKPVANTRGTTPSTNIEYPGTDGVTVTIDGIPQAIRNRFPNIQRVGGATQTIARNGTATFNYANCTTRTTEANPDVAIRKTFTGTVQPINGLLTFNIEVENTGDIDISNFDLTDDYDPNFVEFVSARHGTTNLVPDLHSNPGSNGRRTLTWNNLPEGNTPLTVDGAGSFYNLTLTFRAKNITSGDLNNEAYRNCSNVMSIGYTDNGVAGEREFTINDRRSCAPFIINESNLNVDITKEIAVSHQGRQFRVGDSVVFTATIRNTSNAPYASISFSDTYEASVFRLDRIVVRKGNQSREVTGFANTGSATFANLVTQFFGTLAPGETYVLDLYYTARVSTTSACDTVRTNVTGPGGAGSDQAEKCVPVRTPPPPNTGADIVLNLFVPGLAVIGSIVTKKYLIA